MLDIDEDSISYLFSVSLNKCLFKSKIHHFLSTKPDIFLKEKFESNPFPFFKLIRLPKKSMSINDSMITFFFAAVSFVVLQ